VCYREAPDQIMRACPRACFVAAILLALLPSVAGAQLSELRTEDLRLLYIEATQGFLAPHVARCFQNSLNRQRELWGWKPSQPVTVILVDYSDRGNASAGAVPRNLLLLEIAPLSFVYEIVSANERMNWLMNHELVHIATVDQAAGADLTWRKLLHGKARPISEQPESILYTYLTTPREAAPRWYQEGIAVFVETWMAGGMGRAQGAWDEMVFRAMVRDGSRFHDPLGLVSEGTKIDFQVEVNSYLYGTRFMSYLAYRYGPEQLVAWISRGPDSKRYYSAQFEHVFGRPLAEVWADWVSWEHDFQSANLEAIRTYPTTPYRDLSEHALGSVANAVVDPQLGQILSAFNYPGVVAHLGSISLDTGEVDHILDIKGPVIYSVTSLAYDPASSTLFYTTDNVDFRDLRSLDLKTGVSRMLLEDARIGDLAFNPADRSLWGVRHFNGIATLVQIPYPYEEWRQVHSWPYGEVLYDLAISPDGTALAASLGEINGRHSLRVMPIAGLLAGDVTPTEELSFGVSIPSNFVFSPDGRYLFGSSFYTGVSNIFRYELATDELEAVSNTETGFFRPIPLEDGSLIVFRYTGDGFVPAVIDPQPLADVAPIKFLGQQIVAEHPVLESWKVGSPAEVPLDDLITGRGEYHGFLGLGIESLYPVLQGYREYGAVGFRINFSDPLLLNQLAFTASYTPDQELPSDERLHLKLEFERYDWRAALTLNNADFYDLFGPTKRGLKGYSAELGWSRSLIYDTPRTMELTADVAAYGGLEQVPGYQNVSSPYNSLFSAEVALRYENLRSSLGHVDDEKGHSWEVVATANYVNSKLVPLLRGAFDVGFALPLKHSSIWLRTDAGYAEGDIDDPFAFFYLGGFGNNWVDDREVKRYREWYAFPGVELNEISGQTFAKGLLEWNLPPLRFRKVGWPGFYLSWVRPSVFVSGVAAGIEDSDLRTEVANLGTQFDLQLTALSRLNLTLSLGIARAFTSGGESSDEVMVSLKIL
jgi:hypothetical protein